MEERVLPLWNMDLLIHIRHRRFRFTVTHAGFVVLFFFSICFVAGIICCRCVYSSSRPPLYPPPPSPPLSPHPHHHHNHYHHTHTPTPTNIYTPPPPPLGITSSYPLHRTQNPHCLSSQHGESKFQECVCVSDACVSVYVCVYLCVCV